MGVEESVRKKLHASKEKIDKHNLQKSKRSILRYDSNPNTLQDQSNYSTN